MIPCLPIIECMTNCSFFGKHNRWRGSARTSGRGSLAAVTGCNQHCSQEPHANALQKSGSSSIALILDHHNHHVLFCFCYKGSGEITGDVAREATLPNWFLRAKVDAQHSSEWRGESCVGWVSGRVYITSQVLVYFHFLLKPLSSLLFNVYRYVRLLAISQPDLDADLYSLASQATAMLDKMHPGGKIIEGVGFCD